VSFSNLVPLSPLMLLFDVLLYLALCTSSYIPHPVIIMPLA